MRNTNKNAFFFHNGVPWTARSKVVNISETPKKWEEFLSVALHVNVFGRKYSWLEGEPRVLNFSKNNNY